MNIMNFDCFKGKRKNNIPAKICSQQMYRGKLLARRQELMH